MAEKKIILASTYQHALYTIGVLSNALALAVSGSTSEGVHADNQRLVYLIERAAEAFEESDSSYQDQIIGMRLMPLGSVVVDEDGKLTSNS